VAAAGLALSLLLGLVPVHAAGNESSCDGDAPPSTAALRTVTVDAAASIGSVRSLQGVNGAPAPGTHKPPDFTFGGWNMPENVNVAAGYREARIDLVRTHDAYGPGDIDAHFGARPPRGGFDVPTGRNALVIFPRAQADPNAPESYNFGPTDRLVSSIKGIGAQVLFRLGRSETSDVTPPADFARYAAVAEHIVLHYNRGWAHGFHYGIRYWEIWNEPDLAKLFWGGTPQQFYELYGQLARAVKRADPGALVGGPTLAKPNDASPYREPFLSYVRAERLPLDFFSWHWYATDSNDPMDFVRIARDVRTRLDRSGFKNTLSVLDEWNYGLAYPLPTDVQRASFIASSLIYMQDAAVDVSALYRADNLFGNDGATANKTGQALIALGDMQLTPVRLRVTGADASGFAVLAGRSTDGRTLQVLISNYQIPHQFLGPRAGRNVLSVPEQFEVGLLPRRSVDYHANAGYDLTIGGLAAHQHYLIECHRISGASDLPAVTRAVADGDTIRLRGGLTPPAIELLTIRNAARP